MRGLEQVFAHSKPQRPGSATSSAHRLTKVRTCSGSPVTSSRIHSWVPPCSGWIDRTNPTSPISSRSTSSAKARYSSRPQAALSGVPTSSRHEKWVKNSAIGKLLKRQNPARWPGSMEGEDRDAVGGSARPVESRQVIDLQRVAVEVDVFGAERLSVRHDECEVGGHCRSEEHTSELPH